MRSPLLTVAVALLAGGAGAGCALGFDFTLADVESADVADGREDAREDVPSDAGDLSDAPVDADSGADADGADADAAVGPDGDTDEIDIPPDLPRDSEVGDVIDPDADSGDGDFGEDTVPEIDTGDTSDEEVDGPCVPRMEFCDGRDNDCDGLVDDDDPDTDLDVAAHCGSCANACVAGPSTLSVSCEDATCIRDCVTGHMDVNGDGADGCEYSLGLRDRLAAGVAFSGLVTISRDRVAGLTDHGVLLIDVSDATHPVQLDFYPTTAPLLTGAVVGEWLLVTDDGGVAYLFEHDTGDLVRILRVPLTGMPMSVAATGTTVVFAYRSGVVVDSAAATMQAYSVSATELRSLGGGNPFPGEATRWVVFAPSGLRGFVGSPSGRVNDFALHEDAPRIRFGTPTSDDALADPSFAMLSTSTTDEDRTDAVYVTGGSISVPQPFFRTYRWDPGFPIESAGTRSLPFGTEGQLLASSDDLTLVAFEPATGSVWLADATDVTNPNFAAEPAGVVGGFQPASLLLRSDVALAAVEGLFFHASLSAGVLSIDGELDAGSPVRDVAELGDGSLVLARGSAGIHLIGREGDRMIDERLVDIGRDVVGITASGIYVVALDAEGRLHLLVQEADGALRLDDTTTTDMLAREVFLFATELYVAAGSAGVRLRRIVVDGSDASRRRFSPPQPSFILPAPEGGDTPEPALRVEGGDDFLFVLGEGPEDTEAGFRQADIFAFDLNNRSTPPWRLSLGDGVRSHIVAFAVALPDHVLFLDPFLGLADFTFNPARGDAAFEAGTASLPGLAPGLADETGPVLITDGQYVSRLSPTFGLSMAWFGDRGRLDDLISSTGTAGWVRPTCDGGSSAIYVDGAVLLAHDCGVDLWHVRD